MRIGSEYRWILEGYTPDSIPMTRLAEYMQQLGRLLGHDEAVHFVRVERNCVALISKVDGLSAGRVSSRVASVRRGDGPNDALRAYQTINGMLAEDRGTARLRQGSATVINFPGTPRPEQDVIELEDTGSVVGYLYMLNEAQDGFHARLRLSRSNAINCAVSADMAKVMRGYLFETVKVTGRGTWRRGDEGGWTVVSLHIADVVPADASNLRSIIDEVRRLNLEWPDDPLGYVAGLNGEGGTIQ